VLLVSVPENVNAGDIMVNEIRHRQGAKNKQVQRRKIVSWTEIYVIKNPRSEQYL